MRTRFIKVWCAQCATMQFAGECGHGRVEAPPIAVRVEAHRAEKGTIFSVFKMATSFFCRPDPSTWTEYK